jgi:ferredoxin
MNGRLSPSPGLRGSPADSTAFRPIGSEGAVRLDAARCLALRSRYSDCRRCETACPAGVLRVNDERIKLADGCLRCGRCSAVCPTGALQVEGFRPSVSLPAANGTPVYVDCWKVPLSQSPP